MRSNSLGAITSSDGLTANHIHLLTLTPFYPSEGDDANGCFVSEPLQWLAQQGVRNTVIAVQPFYRGRWRRGNSAVRGEWLRYFSLPGGLGLPTAGAFVFARIVTQLRETHRTQPFHLIHAHGPLPCGHAAMLLSQKLKIPFVVSVHGRDAFSTVQVAGLPGGWCRRISRMVCAAASRVICVSGHVREAVLEAMDRPCQTSVVYNGVDPDHFSPISSAPASGLKILSVGNLIPIKGHESLIRALASLSIEFPAVQLDVIGDGPERGHLERLAGELQVAGKVHFLGRQSRAQVAKAMQQCTVFALPSRYEGLGCVYLEAMSCGKPAIGCRGQGIAEIIREGKNGFLIDPSNNEEELAVTFRTLFRDPVRRSDLGRVARDNILNGLTLEQQSGKLLQIYRESLQ